MGDCRGAGQADGEMDVVLDAACAVAFAACVPGHRGEVRVEFGSDVWGEEGGSVFGAEDRWISTKERDCGMERGYIGFGVGSVRGGDAPTEYMSGRWPLVRGACLPRPAA